MLEICLPEAYGVDTISCAFLYVEPALWEHRVVTMQPAAVHCYSWAVIATRK